ncbi:MAG TPA: YDG domain-containing protein [Verrucomicrobiae bacterium]|nr:YDG domain-containing protein [Verrucomicrobiae bacterium]
MRKIFCVLAVFLGLGVVAASASTLTVSGLSVNGKTYDGTNTATVNFGSAVLNGVSPSDTGNVSLVTNGYSANFNDKNVGNGKAVSVSGLTLTGSAASSYTLTQPTLSGNITARTLVITAAGVNKTYDATTNASVSLSDNKIAGDDVADFYDTASFADKNVGTGKSVFVDDIFITGTDANNYTQSNTTATATANITTKTLHVAATGQNKPYDGTVTATVTFSDNHLAGDSITDTYTSATFADQYVGNGKTISVSGIAISGPDAVNYTLSGTTAHAQANITARALNITATGQNKPYDGTTNATVTLGDDRLGGDDITVSFSSAGFSNKNAGTNKTVSVYGLIITGPDSDSYTPASPVVTTTANISSRTLTVVASGQSKVYDGTTNASVTLSDNRLTGDTLTNVYTSASFANKNVGNGKTVTVTGISLAGLDAGNYGLGNTTATTPANITVRTLNVTATGIGKAYDGTTNASVALNDDRVSGDSLTDTYTVASFTDKNAGTGKSINVMGIQFTGTDAANYSLGNTTATATATITGRTLTVSATGQNKVYDGTTNATVTLSDNRLTGDTLTNTYTAASFDNKNVGNGKTVTVTGISLAGSDAVNYTLGNTSATTPANITVRSLNVTATGVSKAYDGTTNASVTLNDDRVSGDSLTATYTSASFTDKNAGTGKTINVMGIQVTGSDAANYSLNNVTASATASITGRTLNVAATGQDKIYDGTTNATVTLSDNRLAGDSITVGYTAASFSDKRVGSGKTIAVTGITVTGANASNYTLAGTNTSTTAAITVRPLVVTATGVNKTYDGTTTATANLADNRIAGDVLTDSYGSASFTSSSVGNGKTVNVADIFISGTDSGNYTLSNTTASTTANITAVATVAALTSSQNPSGFRDNLTFTETLPSDATGTVTYFTNGVTFNTGPLAGGAFTSGSISNLVRGTNIITAVYSGDGNYAGITNSLSQVVTNHPPLTGFFTFSVTNGVSLKVKISDLLTAVLDPDGDPVTLTGVGVSTNGMVSPTNSTLILFRNTNYVNDRFSYVVADDHGGSSTGQVNVISVLAPFIGQSTSMAPAGGTNFLTNHGIPGYTYIIQRSVNLLTWVDIATNTAASNGTISSVDTFRDLGGAPGSAFYRMKWQP